MDVFGVLHLVVNLLKLAHLVDGLGDFIDDWLESCFRIVHEVSLFITECMNNDLRIRWRAGNASHSIILLFLTIDLQREWSNREL
jgi:hypothetical protein